jgi:hypothetical protein
LESLEGRDCSEDTGMDGKVISKWILEENSFGRCELDSSAQYRGRRRDLLNTVSNLLGP